MKRVAILGSTGSIGSSALAVIDAHPERLSVVALAAGRNAEALALQVRRYRPALAGIADEALVGAIQAAPGTRVLGGPQALIEVATHPDVDVVLCASSGTAALEAVLAAIEAGKTIALANKEVLVMAGGLVTTAARRHNAALLPVDSEHNAIHQCLHGRSPEEITRLVLTASGGAFRDWPASSLDEARPADALRHPTWQMGRKITIDSATLMNKGLEVIEAHWLFDVDPVKIDVVIHPQSVVHSLVELRDGSVIAQLGVTDMRLPIQYAFSYPERWGGGLPALDLTTCGPLEFSEPDRRRFPCLDLAYAALAAGGSAPVVLNAANEIAVEAYLDGAIRFTTIPRLIERALEARVPCGVGTLDEIRAADAWAREYVRAGIAAVELKA